VEAAGFYPSLRMLKCVFAFLERKKNTTQNASKLKEILDKTTINSINIMRAKI
jgi:hypothetical protein